jgi:hypothetical protein
MASLHDIDCAACLALLSEYVRLQLIGQPIGATHREVPLHIETCPTCQAAYFREFRTQGLAKPLSELQQVGRRAGAARALDTILQSTSATWWQLVSERFYRMTMEIPILVKETAATFGNLPALLAPQRTLAGALRSKRTVPENEAEAIELLTLPNPAADLLIKVSTGTVTNYKSTLIIQLETMTHQPIPQVRTSLRDRNGSLLEQRASDTDGLVIFGDLETTRYCIQVKHAGQIWEFSVALVARQ